MPTVRVRNFIPLLFALALGLLLRVLLWNHIPRLGLVSDEGEYLAAATWFAQGRNFTWYNQYLWTRAPIYPLFVAVHLWLFRGHVEAVYVTQTILSLSNVVLVYVLSALVVRGQETRRQGDKETRRQGDKETRRQGDKETNSSFVLHPSSFILHPSSLAPFLAALLMALYLPFALYPQVLLSETLYLTLLLGGFVALGASSGFRSQEPEARSQEPKSSRRHPAHRFILIAIGGVLFGLAALTRSLTLGFIPVIVLWLLVRRPSQGSGDRDQGLGRQGEGETRRGGQENKPSTSSPSILSPRRLATDKGRTLRLLSAAVFALAAALVVLPWTVYNSARLYSGLVVVDTTGAFNLMLGARAAYDGSRSDATSRNFALAMLGQLGEVERASYRKASLDQGGSCLHERDSASFDAALGRAPAPQAELQRLMTSEGLCLIQKRPLAFVQKTAGELLDFFQINYSGDERFTDGFGLGRLPQWYSLALFLLDDTLYVLALPLAAIGYALRASSEFRVQNSKLAKSLIRNLQSIISNLQFLILLWFLFNIAVAPVLFAINRFRLPLLPFAFVFAAYALANLRGIDWRWLRTRGGILGSSAATALFLVAATPYAYFEPREPGKDSEWASYLGPYPSSVASTITALALRADFLEQEQMRLALRQGKPSQALEHRPSEIRLKRVNRTVAVTNTVLLDAMLAHAEGRTEEALALLPEELIIARRDVEAAVVRGDMLRSLGRNAEANALLTNKFVDDANPVEWAWNWLDPPPTTNINLGGNLDIGYVRGCYLGESIRNFDDANYRWCSDGAQIRFPQAGTGAAQTLVLRADGRGWQGYAQQIPATQILTGQQTAGSFTASFGGPQEYRIVLPPTPAGDDVVVTLRTETFIPPADDYNRQQGPLANQVRRLGVRLDWVALR